MLLAQALPDDRMIPVYGILAGVVVIVLLALLFGLSRRRKEAVAEKAETARQDKHIEESIKRGDILKDPLTGAIHHACLICRGIATELMPQSGTNWMDRIPGMSLLNRLFSLPPRYTIVDNEIAGTKLCRSHKQVSVKILEEFHAILRAERASFNATQESKVAAMDSGGLQLRATKIHQDTKEAQQAAAAALFDAAEERIPTRQLAMPAHNSASESVVVTTSTVSQTTPDPLDLDQDKHDDDDDDDHPSAA